MRKAVLEAQLALSEEMQATVTQGLQQAVAFIECGHCPLGLICPDEGTGYCYHRGDLYGYFVGDADVNYEAFIITNERGSFARLVLRGTGNLVEARGDTPQEALEALQREWEQVCLNGLTAINKKRMALES